MKDERKAAAKLKREQQVKRQKLILAVVGIFIMITAIIYISFSCGKEENIEASATEVEEVETIEITVPEKTETLEERVERVRKEAKEADYPEDVIELLAKNPETVDFVENYGEQKDRKPASEIAEFVDGKIPQILQWDARWGYSPYGTGIVAVCGCGPTCLSMVVSGLTGDETLTPDKIAEYGTNHGYITEQNDTRWVFMYEAAKEWGINSREKMLSEEEVKKELKMGHPIICSVGPGDFTKIGHFIVLARCEDGKIIVHDPFSQKNSDKRWDFQEFEDQIKSMWIYSVDE